MRQEGKIADQSGSAKEKCETIDYEAMVHAIAELPWKSKVTAAVARTMKD